MEMRGGIGGGNGDEEDSAELRDDLGARQVCVTGHQAGVRRGHVPLVLS